MDRLEARIDHPRIIALADGEAAVVPTQGCAYLTLIPAAGATITYSDVDSSEASAHDATTQQTTTATLEITPPTWPFVRVSTAGGAARVCAG